MERKKYKAVVFDLDGTAVNSQYNIDALQMTCISELGREATEKELQYSYGMTARNAIRYLGVADENAEHFERVWIENIMELCKNATLFDGIYEGMVKMKEAGIMVGVNTSRRSDELGELRTYIKEPFLDLCSLIVTCDLVKHPKPAPDSLDYFLQKTGLKPEELLLVGDSEFDAGCAKNAGCDFALATWGCFFPDEIEAEYKPEKPIDLVDIAFGC